MLLSSFKLSLSAVKISQAQFQLQDVQLRQRGVLLGQVFCLKSLQHIDDGFHLADVREQLISQPFPLARPFHDPADIAKLNLRGSALG